MSTNITTESATTSGATAKLPETLELQHKVFSAFDSCHFQRSVDDGQVVLVIRMGDAAPVSLPLGAMMREFGIIADSQDGRLLELLDEALHYVTALKPGDPIPKEVLCGEASWDVEDYHRQVAYNRLTMQLVTWMSGSEELITDPDQLLQIAEDPSTKKKVNDAFGEVAEKLGLGRERREEVTHWVHDVASELAYIESLRDKFRLVTMIQSKLQQLRRLYGHERATLETVSQVVKLMEEAIGRFQDTFDQVDAQTGEIIAVLKNIESQKQFIRSTRDDLYRRLFAWDELFDRWQKLSVERSDAAVILVRDSYQFLAPRYMKVKEWVLYTQVVPGEAKKRDLKATVEKGPGGRTMTW